MSFIELFLLGGLLYYIVKTVKEGLAKGYREAQERGSK